MGAALELVPVASSRSSSCAHRWVRRPAGDPSVRILSYQCEAGGAGGERRFCRGAETRVIDPKIDDYWDRGRVRTESDRRRHSFVQLSVEEVMDGQVLTFAEVCSPPRRKRSLRR